MEQITIIKYGTAVLTTKDFSGDSIIDQNIINQHGAIITKYHNPIFLVSSGAVGFGRIVLKEEEIKSDPITQKRILAEIGQPKLFRLWQKSLPDKIVLQKLVTYADLKRKSTEQTIKVALENELLYVFNFNDGVDDTELKEDENHQFGDNDNLATEIAMACQGITHNCRLIVNTCANGVTNSETGEIFSELKASEIDDHFIHRHCKGLSNGGTGGMASKLHYLKQAMDKGLNEAWIINGKDPIHLKNVLNGGHSGTKIITS